MKDFTDTHQRIYDAIQRADFTAVRSAFDGLSLADARRCATGYGFTPGRAESRDGLLEWVVQQARDLTPAARASCAKREERERALLEATSVIENMENGRTPISVVGECMARFGLTYAEFNLESGRCDSLAGTGRWYIASPRIQAVIDAERRAEMARAAALLRQHAPEQTELIARAESFDQFRPDATAALIHEHRRAVA
ncbi:MAG: hypothetical protein E6Q76_19670 [Rhizobium sp.]|nr:MAG: hypothetical protein E6Q76_19670 [Rhizobium sp.]